MMWRGVVKRCGGSWDLLGFPIAVFTFYFQIPSLFGSFLVQNLLWGRLGWSCFKLSRDSTVPFCNVVNVVRFSKAEHDSTLV